MVDLHIHTNYSDGIYPVEYILEQAYNLNLKTISITDHNTVDAYFHIRDKHLTYPYHLIPGVELKCCYQKEIVELLVYDFDIDQMKQFIADNYMPWEKINRQSTKLFLEKLEQYAIYYDKNMIMNHDYSKYNGIMELYYNALQYEGNIQKFGDDYLQDVPSFFREKVCDITNRFYIDLSVYYPTVETIMQFCRKCNGNVFMPHVYVFKNGFELMKKIHR